jgi:hypothetical protein
LRRRDERGQQREACEGHRQGPEHLDLERVSLQAAREECGESLDEVADTGFGDSCNGFTRGGCACGYEAGRGGVGSAGGGSFEVEVGEVEISEVGIAASRRRESSKARDASSRALNF